MSLLLKMEDVSIRYNEKQVVSDLNLTIKKGEILGIVGESGSGKSTIIKAALGLLDLGGKVDSGTIFYKDMNLLQLSKKEYQQIRGTCLGSIPQDSKGSFCPVKTIEEHLYEALSKGKIESKSKVREEAIQILKQLNVSDAKRFLQSYPFQLSGGMNQRAAIMIAILQKPCLLFADEPTSALDVISQKHVVTTLMKQRSLDTAMLIVTHNIGLATYMADQILVMKKGRIVEYGETKEVMSHPKDSYTKTLLAAVPRIKRGIE
ncbi:MAG: ABC transporter ATP-binding protein [Candidatus Galacturonibacter soehngenii]|nr:ABC transporter ATP-binding protein [Candidatus Galacturonibacter soehngenii]